MMVSSRYFKYPFQYIYPFYCIGVLVFNVVIYMIRELLALHVVVLGKLI